MYLQRLEVQGFKSFANKIALDFDQGITCIVGPNGSGKSNIADAIRWVQGEQSLKIIRGKKAEDVIFAGSKKKGQLGFAEVTLVLNNEDESAPIDYSEVSLTRRVYRSGESEYFINKNKVRLIDVQYLLTKSNIGQRTYNVIGQGMIDAVLIATPAERKQFFDEAAGIKQFQIKRDQAIHKLVLTRENLQQAQTLLAEIEPRLRSLTRQVKRLERREAIERDLAVLLRVAYTQRWREASTARETKKAELEHAEGERKAAADVVAKHEASLDRMAKSDSRVAAFRQLQAALTEAVTQRNSLLRERAVLKGKGDLEWERQGDANLVWYEKHKEELDHQQAQLQEQLDAATERVATITADITAREGTQTNVREEFAAVERRLAEAESQFGNVGTLNPAELKDELIGFQTGHERFLRRLGRVQTVEELATLQKDSEVLSADLNTIVERVEQVASAVSAESIQRLRQELMHFVESRDTLVNELTGLRADLQIQESKRTHLREQLQHVGDELSRVRQDLDLARLGAKDKSAALTEIDRRAKDIDTRIADAEKAEHDAQVKVDAFNADEESKKRDVFGLQKEVKDARERLTRTTAVVNEHRVELARLDAHAEDLLREMSTALEAADVEAVKTLQEPPTIPDEYQGERLESAIEKLRHQLELIGGIDPEVHREYGETEERYSFLKAQCDDLSEGIEKTETVIVDLDQTIKEQFDRSFAQISKQFTEYFRILFRGGSANLSLVKEVAPSDDVVPTGVPTDETAPAEEPTAETHVEKIVSGVEINATPPGKRLRGIAMLSGGERALTSIALICAILASNPSPFVVLDEVDAALDEANSERFAAILRKLAHQSQFVTITHNRATMHEAKILYGVTMGDDGVSKVLSLKLEEAEEQAFANR